MRFLLLIMLAFRVSIIFGQDVKQLRKQAEAHFGSGEYSRSFLLFQKAIIKAGGNKDIITVADIHNDVGTLMYVQEKYREAISHAHAGLGALKLIASPPDSVRFKLYSSLGEFYKKARLKDSSLFYFNKANQIVTARAAVQTEIPGFVRFSFNNQALLYKGEGDYEKAIIFLKKALSIDPGNLSDEDKAIMLNNIAGCYERLGQFSEAIAFETSAIRLYPENGIEKCSILASMAWNYISMEKPQKALQYIAQANKIYKLKSNYTNVDLETTLMYYKGLCFKIMGDLTQAETSFLKSASRFEAAKVKKDKNLGNCYIELGEIERKRGDQDKALAFFQKAVIASSHFDKTDWATNPGIDKVLFAQTFIKSATLKADVLLEKYKKRGDQNHLVLSSQTFRIIIKQLKKQQINYDLTRSKLEFYQQVLPVFEKGIAVFKALYLSHPSKENLEALITITEESKSIVLSDTYYAYRSGPKYIPAHIMEEEQAFRSKITRAEAALNDPGIDAARAKKLEAEITEARITQAIFLRKIEIDYPTFYKVRYKLLEFSIRDFQNRLDDRTGAIQYKFSGNDLIINTITRHKTSSVIMKDVKAGLQESAGLLYRYLSENPGITAFRGGALSQDLYRHLLLPIRQNLSGTSRLIILRDDFLNFIPFEMLKNENGKHLLREYAVSYCYNFQTFFSEKESSRKDNSTLAMAPFVNVKRKDWDALYYSLQEIEALNGDKFINESATKQKFLEIYQRYNILHFATHANLDDKPFGSYIVFAPDSVDFFLKSEEIANLNLIKSKLAVLTACKSGIGELHKGEGLMSLAKAFAFAGCPSVASTLWDSHDRSVAYISDKFHAYLNEGLPKDVALQKAKIDFQDSDTGARYDHPYFWANLILIGDSEPTETFILLSPASLGKLLLTVTMAFCFFMLVKKFTPL